MREILFRAKAINRVEGREYRSNYINGEWVYGYYAHLPSAVGVADIIYVPASDPDDSNHTVFVDPETLGQFTGLTDENDVKIFEGDIVKTYDPDDIPAVVVYDESETQYGIVIDNIYYCLGAQFRGIDLEVVGNIYDNPELIEDGDADEES
jgi:hypothetical protein